MGKGADGESAEILKAERGTSLEACKMLTTPHFLFSEHSPQYVANVSFLHLFMMCTIFWFVP